MTPPKLTRVVVYPNNSVEIDGKPIRFTRADFRQYRIEIIRKAHTGPQMDGWRERIGNTIFIIFPTHALTQKLTPESIKVLRDAVPNNLKKQRMEDDNARQRSRHLL